MPNYTKPSIVVFHLLFISEMIVIPLFIKPIFNKPRPIPELNNTDTVDLL